MGLFVAEHRHAPENCPAAAAWGPALLSHVCAATAAHYGVAIQAEAVIDGHHCFTLIVEAADRTQVERFMGFFQRFGSVTVYPASISEAAVARGGCDAARPGDGARQQAGKESDIQRSPS